MMIRKIPKALPLAAKAKLPARTVRGLCFHGLSPLAVNVFLWAAWLWDQRQHELRRKGVPPSERTQGDFKLSVRWRILQAHLMPEAQAAITAHDYRALYAAVDEVMGLRACRLYLKDGKRWRTVMGSFLRRLDHDI